jgi:hypothetical protein
MSQADQIRAYIFRHFIQGIEAGEIIKIRAGDVHHGMGLQSRMPNVCSVLDGNKLAAEFSLELISRSGPHQGANVYYTFKILRTTTREQPPHLPTIKPKISKIKKTSLRTIAPNKDKMPKNAICLVSCVGKKQTKRVAAKDLYISDWFIKARRFVESKGYSWFILSAEHGLIDPGKLLSPYEKTLNTMGVRDRREWARKVLKQIDVEIPNAKSFIFLAGQRYRENLVEPLRLAGSSIYIPMEGLTIGRQLSWLGERI